MKSSIDITETDRIKATLSKLAKHIEKNPNSSIDLCNGDLGKVLYYFYGSRSLHDKIYGQRGINQLKKIINIVKERKNKKILNPALGSGITGLGLTLEVLVNEGLLSDSFEKYLKNIDQYVFERSLKLIQNGNTDFLYGGAGGFHYLFFRLSKNKKVLEYLYQFVFALEKIALNYDNTVYFPNSHLNPVIEPNEIKLGISHGMPAVILILINLYEADILPDITSRLIRKSINFIIQYHNADFYETATYTHFPNSVFLGESKFSAKSMQQYNGGLRWCYGDLNITHLLYKASKALQVKEWLTLAENTGLSTLNLRDIPRTRCQTAFFCHGASGIAYYYKYISRISNNQDYMEGYKFWTNEMYRLLDFEVKQPTFTSTAGGFLHGFVGTSLILMSALESEDPYWEKIWLLC